jgi:hypothetical protein
MFPLNTILAWSINIIMNKKYDNNNIIIIASRAYFLQLCSMYCRNAQSESHSDPHDICMLALFYQLPNYNLFTQHVIIYPMERHH